MDEHEIEEAKRDVFEFARLAKKLLLRDGRVKIIGEGCGDYEMWRHEIEDHEGRDLRIHFFDGDILSAATSDWDAEPPQIRAIYTSDGKVADLAHCRKWIPVLQTLLILDVLADV